MWVGTVHVNLLLSGEIFSAGVPVRTVFVLLVPILQLDPAFEPELQLIEAAGRVLVRFGGGCSTGSFDAAATPAVKAATPAARGSLPSSSMSHMP